MPEEAQGLQDKGSAGEEGPQVALVPDIIVPSSEGEGKHSGSNILELDDLSALKHSAQNSDVNLLKGNDESGLGVSEVSVQVGVAKTAQALEPFKTTSLLKGTCVTPPRMDHDVPVGSSDKLQNGSSTSLQMNSDSDYSSSKSGPGYACSNVSTSTFDQELSELDVNSNSPVSLSTSTLDTENSLNNDGSNSKTVPHVSFKDDSQARDVMDVRWDGEDVDDDRQSTQSRKSVKEGVCCCYQAFHRAFLQCVEETPAMLSGLLLSLLFCVAIIILIPTTGRVRQCLCVHLFVHLSGLSMNNNKMNNWLQIDVNEQEHSWCVQCVV